MSLKKFWYDVKEELDNINYLRSKIIYPEGPLDDVSNDKKENRNS